MFGRRWLTLLAIGFLWWNFREERDVELATPPQTDAEAVQYIPQSSPVQGLYHVYRAQGHDVLTALEKVLLAVTETARQAPMPQ